MAKLKHYPPSNWFSPDGGLMDEYKEQAKEEYPLYWEVFAGKAAKWDDNIYVDLQPDQSCVDGWATAEDLRAIAAGMDMLRLLKKENGD